MKLDSLFNTRGLAVAFTLLILALSIFVTLATTEKAKAAPVAGFNAGNIIDDGIFYDKNSMTASQIQSFLNSQIKNCDTWGTSPSEYGGGTRAQYAKKTWNIDPPFVCLNNYHEDPTSTKTSFGQGGGAFSGGISAARIIYNAAQEYGINPKVLLVMLKKESGGPLTSDTWPLKSQYKYAMGYACPDSGPGYSANCTSSKAGFYKQMMLAAWQLNYYREHPNDYRYKIGWNNIQYDTDPACGTKRVNIQNIATLSLYIYTPYTPNNAALAAYPGEAHCGAYGNRNFYQFFKEWFGSPNTGNHGYSATRITGTGSSSTTMEAGETKKVSVKFKNTGIMPWYDIDSYVAAEGRPVILQALHPNLKDTSGFNTDFTTSTRATEKFATTYTSGGTPKSDTIVNPGESVKFDFELTAPEGLTPKKYSLAYMPVIPALNGLQRINITPKYDTFYITIIPDEVATEPELPPQEQELPDTSLMYPMTSSTHRAVRINGPGLSSDDLLADEPTIASVYFKNTGKTPWYDIESAENNNKRPAVLMWRHVDNKSTSAFNGSFPTSTRATQRISRILHNSGEVRASTTSTRIVMPGEIGKFTFTLTAPQTSAIRSGTYRASYSLVIPANGESKRIELSNPNTFYMYYDSGSLQF